MGIRRCPWVANSGSACQEIVIDSRRLSQSNRTNDQSGLLLRLRSPPARRLPPQDRKLYLDDGNRDKQGNRRVSGPKMTSRGHRHMAIVAEQASEAGPPLDLTRPPAHDRYG